MLRTRSLHAVAICLAKAAVAVRVAVNAAEHALGVSDVVITPVAIGNAIDRSPKVRRVAVCLRTWYPAVSSNVAVHLRRMN